MAVKVLEVVDVEIEFMGNYFVDNSIGEKENLSFSQFMEQVKQGRKLEEGKGVNN